MLKNLPKKVGIIGTPFMRESIAIGVDMYIMKSSRMESAEHKC